MATPHFRLRNLKDKDGLKQCYLVYSQKGREVCFNMPFKINPDYWLDYNGNVTKGKGIKVSSKHDKYFSINKELEDNINHLNNIITDYRRKNLVLYNPDVDYVKEKFYSNDPVKAGENTLLFYFDEFIKDKKESGKNIKRVNSIKKDLEEFLGRKKDKTYLKDLDYRFLTDFKLFLFNRKLAGDKIGQHNSVIKKKFGIIISFLNQKSLEGRQVKDDYLKFKLERLVEPDSELPIVMPTKKDIDTLYNMDLSSRPYLERVRDKFLIGCYTGLRFSDILKLSKNNVRDGVFYDGKRGKYLIVITSKTGRRVETPLYKECELILNRNDWNLKHISNKSVNVYLKQLFQLLDSYKEKVDILDRVVSTKKEIINIEKYKLIHFHISRAYFITDCLYKKIPIPVVMGYSGHSGSFTVFENYINKNPQIK